MVPRYPRAPGQWEGVKMREGWWTGDYLVLLAARQPSLVWEPWAAGSREGLQAVSGTHFVRHLRIYGIGLGCKNQLDKMKKILLNTIYIFMLVQMGTGSVYRLFYDNCRNEPLLKLIGLNVIMLAVSFLFSYLGYLADKKRGQA
ncbi:MAG: hypothetical protein RLZZ165_2078 [Bacteroidota bacterium]